MPYFCALTFTPGGAQNAAQVCKTLTMSTKYHPEQYWSEVGELINQRDGTNVIAGDDEPYYHYKRVEFLKLLHSFDFKGKNVLEVGSGPGGNLLEVYKHQPAKVMGADISQTMVDLANKNTPDAIRIVKVDGTQLPFEDKSLDAVFTATVLQHNTDEQMLMALMHEIARISGDRVILFERIENTILGDDLCLGRPVNYYAQIMKSQGFELVKTDFINIRVSYYVCGAIRKLLNPKDRKEGEPLTPFSVSLQKFTLAITKVLDKIFTSKKDLAKLEFARVK